MALILRYRVEPHPGINNEIYQALAAQVGKVGIQIQLNIGPPESPESTQVLVQGQFVSVEGEHAATAKGDDRTAEERASGPSSLAADRAASEGGP